MAAVKEETHLPADLSFSRPTDDTLLLKFTGSWIIEQKLPSADEFRSQIGSGSTIKRIAFDSNELAEWDSGLLTFLMKIVEACKKNRLRMNINGLPAGVRRLLKLALAVPEKKGARKEVAREPFFSRIGATTIEITASLGETLAFLGESFIAFVRFLVGKARFRRSDLALFVQEAGAQALPIVSLISMLVGLILAFVGAVQLQMFGAQIYVANLVGLAMVREMGAMMAAIIMAGRTGAAYAAQLGTMQVNEEIDALQTMGISPMEFLVLPRMLALVLMLPLLALYANLMGILGGFIVGIGMLDITVSQYYHQTIASLNLTHFAIGVFKAGIFGILIAISGCMQGMRCGRSASAVGGAATSAVVYGIVFIIVADAIATIVCNVLGI